MAYSLANVYFLSCSKPHAALGFIRLFTSVRNVKSRSQNACPVDIQDTKDTCHHVGLSCIYLFGVKSLYPVVVRSDAVCHSDFRNALSLVYSVTTAAW